MKILLYIAPLVALVGCLPTEPTQLDQYPTPQPWATEYPMGAPPCELEAYPSAPIVRTDSGAYCPRTKTYAEVVAWRWNREHDGSCSIAMPKARLVYGCFDTEPI